MRSISRRALKIILIAAFITSLSAASAVTQASTMRVQAVGHWTSDVAVAAENCEFLLGFNTLHDMIPTIVGDCLENEWHNPENGDGLQRTTNGLLVWRKADNWTAYTDGHTTWINGPLGLQSRLNSERFSWEPVDAPVPVAIVSPQPPPSASIPPQANTVVQLAIDDAARQTGVDPSGVRVVSVESREWSDTSLGCPQPGMMYAQVITPGFLVVLEASGRRLEYHTDTRRAVVLC